MTEEQIQEIRQAIEVYEAADNNESHQRARFVIDLHAPDWTKLLLDEIDTYKQQQKQLTEAMEEIKEKEWELAGEQTPVYLIAHFALQQIKGAEES